MGKKDDNTQKVKSLFQFGQMTVQDLIEEIKSQKPEKASPEEIKLRKQQLANLIQKTVNPLKQKMKDLWRKMKTERNYFERLKASHEYDKIKQRLLNPDLNISWQRNEIRKMEGKDYYYTVNTQFGSHKIKRSEILASKGNSLFLNLMKNDVLDAIKELESSKQPGDSKKAEILRSKLLPVIQFNIEVDKVREADIKKIEKKMAEKIIRAADNDKDKNEKQGQYPIEVILSGELIELL